MSFNQLNEQLRRALAKEGYTTPTPIQQQAIPHLLEGKDLLGIAQTGTGKTAAFVLPILHLMAKNPKPTVRNSPRVLVLAPTRELAAQIDDSFAAYGAFMRFYRAVIFGGVPQGAQVKAVSRGVDVLVATPGRLLDLMEQGYITLKNVEFFVLDEADRMLDMGFIHDIKRIISQLPRKKQSLFFSATMPHSVSALAASLLVHPVRVEITPAATTVERIDQKVFFVDHSNKDALLYDLLSQKDMGSVLVFTRTKHRANKLAISLSKKGIPSDAIHGNKSQGQRVKALDNFRAGRIKVLVATDIAARGIDVEGISHVINYELPNEPESYVHRIGRTARAGADGTAYSFCSSEERAYLRDIERTTRIKLEVVEHKYHSAAAQESLAPKPPMGGGGGYRGGSRHGGHHGGNRFGGNRSHNGNRQGSRFGRPDRQDAREGGQRFSHSGEQRREHREHRTQYGNREGTKKESVQHRGHSSQGNSHRGHGSYGERTQERGHQNESNSHGNRHGGGQGFRKRHKKRFR